MSPEQLLGEPQSSATDVFGLGLLIFEMLAGHTLLDAHNPVDSLFNAKLNELYPDDLFADIPANAVALIRACLRRHAQQRPSVAEVIERLSAMSLLDSGRFASVSAASQELTTGSHLIPRQSRFNPPFPLVAFGVAIILAGIIFAQWHRPVAAAPTRAVSILAGLGLAAGGGAAGWWLRRTLGRKQSNLGSTALSLAFDAKRRVDLTATIALQVDELIRRLHELDERILAGTVALMLNEYHQSTEGKDRQSALMNVVALSEKLSQRLSPWYVRYKDVIATVIAVIGGVSGLVTAISGVMSGHKP
jgi:uncharacterized membrane protein